MQELSLHVLDLVQNSVRAGATAITVSIEEATAERLLTITIADNGCGMDAALLEQALLPGFTTKEQGGGRGLPLFKEAAERTGGTLSVESSPGLFTRVRARFHTDHPKYIKIGSMSDTFVIVMVGHPDVAFTYERSCDDRSFSLSTTQMKQTLGSASLSAKPVLEWTVTTIEGQTAQLCSEA